MAAGAAEYGIRKMKVRSGFVSNSSSSSYIVALNGNLTKEGFLKALQLEPGSPLYNSYVDLFQYCMQTRYGAVMRNEEEFFAELDRNYGISKEDIQPDGDYFETKWPELLNLIRSGFQMFSALLSHNEDSTEMQYGSMIQAIEDTENIIVIQDY